MDKNDFTSKSIEDLENDYWKEPEFKSGLTMMCYQARKKRINELNEDEICTLIRQKIGLEYLLPVAVKKIEEYMNNINDFYLSGLLDTILSLDNNQWINNEEQKEKFTSNLFDCLDNLNEEYFKKSDNYLKKYISDKQRDINDRTNQKNSN